MAMLGQFLRVPRNFENFLDTCWQAAWSGRWNCGNPYDLKFGDIIDAVYHEADHYLKWPHSANVRIFWSRPAEGAVVLWKSCINCGHRCCRLYQILLNIPATIASNHIHISCPMTGHLPHTFQFGVIFNNILESPSKFSRNYFAICMNYALLGVVFMQSHHFSIIKMIALNIHKKNMTSWQTFPYRWPKDQKYWALIFFVISLCWTNSRVVEMARHPCAIIVMVYASSRKTHCTNIV